MTRFEQWLAVALIILIIVLPGPRKGEVLILREDIVNDGYYGETLLIDWVANGVPGNAHFGKTEEAEYNALMAHLSRIGNIVKVED